MQDFPHHYAVNADAKSVGNVVLSTAGAPILDSAPPVEFGGPGDQWSPESLLVAAIADCFILSFRAIASASRMDWTSLNVAVIGTLDRVDRVTQFTQFSIEATLTVAESADEAKATRLLQKAEHACLVTNSLKAETHLDAVVQHASH